MDLPPGKPGTLATLDVMRAAALHDAKTSALVLDVASRLKTAAGIESFIRKWWVVVPDPLTEELIVTPSRQLAVFRRSGRLTGDCDDAATLAASLLASLGIPAALVAIRMPGDAEFSHVWTRGGFPGAAVDIDPIVPAENLPITNDEERIEVVL